MMDAIKNVENEVDRVLRLFTNCKDNCHSQIDQLLDLVDKSQKEIENLTTNGDLKEFNDQRAQNIIQNTCDTIQKSCTQITNSHRELHVPVSKIGKSIDKNFSSDFACICLCSSNDHGRPRKDLLRSQENHNLLNYALVQHFLRSGMTNIAVDLIKEAKLTIDEKELVKFDEVDEVLTSLRRRELRLALNWAVKNRKRLRDIDSPLEFKLHRINIIDLYKKGIDKQHEIIQYARSNLQHLDRSHQFEIQHLMGGIIYLKTGIENSPYRDFLDPINYKEIEDIFVSNACALLDLSARSPIAAVFDAGCLALPPLLNMNQMLSSQGVQSVWQARDELPVEIELDRKLQFHSTFSCPILKQQSTEGNPPMRLYCGHVISRDALQKLTGTGGSSKLKCPYCPVEQNLNDAMQIYF